MNFHDTTAADSAPRPRHHPASHQPPSYEPGGMAHQSTLARPTTQAERAVMHPDHHDPDWRYYHAAGVG